MKHILLIGAPIAALLAIPAIAQPSQPPATPAAPGGMHMEHGGWDEAKTRAEVEAKIAERFAAADTDRDGAVTDAEMKTYVDARMAEARTRMTERHAEVFVKLDTDRNGQVSRAEWDAHHAAMMTRFGERREGAGKDGARGERKMGMGRKMRWQGGWSERWFETADANNDGRVTLAEAQAKPLARFDRLDANKDGTLTPEERKAGREAMRAEWRAKRGS